MAIKKRNDEEFIDSLIQPISDIYEETNYKVLSIITSRIKEIGKMTPTDAGRLSILLKNQDLKQIEKVLSDATKLSIKEIDSIVEQSASYNDDLSTKLYEAKNLPPSSISTDLGLLNVVETAKKQMVDDVVNLSRTTGFMVNGKMTDVAKTYNYAVNRAVFEVQQGLFDFNTAMRSTIKELADSGIRTVDFASGYSRRADSQISMNISDGVRNLNMNYRELQGKRFGADGVEISAHALSAPDHIFAQGRQFSNKEFEMLQSTLARPIGSLNCKHSIHPILLGISEPAYSDKELNQYKENSDKQVEYSTLKKDSDGKFIKNTLSRYDASQKMRQIETNIRQLKDVRNQLSLNNDNIGVAEYERKIKQKTAYYKKVADEVGLKPQMDRTRVYSPK